LILDSSAAVSVILREQGHADLVEAMDAASELAIGAPTLFETSIVVVRRYGEIARSLVANFVRNNGVAVIPFGERHRSLATEAFVRYGKGRHPARLNYGDCMTYATARLAGRPLLFVGDDFARTDLPAALA
jgi:ribonuclease VapC